MSGGWELVAVSLVVAAAGTWAVRALVRSLKKPGGCSSCAGSGVCPLVKGMGATETPEECPTESGGQAAVPRT
jgi:hypothetical protein